MTVCDVNSVLLLTSGVVSTVLLLVMQGYWIYFEERSKGSLRRTIRVFDLMHDVIETRFGSNKLVRLIQPVATEEKGSN